MVADAEEVLVTKELIKVDKIEAILSEAGMELESMGPEAMELGVTGVGVTATEET
jgi:hypothetical protein